MLFRILVVLVAAWVAQALPAAAWERHDLLTAQILRRAEWLGAFRDISVLAASGSECPDCDKDPYNPAYLPVFIDRLPGERSSAREILVRYVDEPDWGMDEAVEVSPLQALAGGSKGYRHQYYYFAAGVVRVGQAPDRVRHFYDLAVAAYKAGDRYWAFRHLARALHYLEDLGQPLHTRPILYQWLRRTRLDVARTTMLASNLHYAYERWVAWHVKEDIRRGGGPLVRALREAPTLKFIDPETAARALAEFSANRAPDLLADLDAYWPKRVKSTRDLVLPRATEIRPRTLPPTYHAIMGSTVRSLEVMAAAVVSVLDMARRDFAAADKARHQED